MSVIDQLRDDYEYYSGVGKNYLSNSDISALLTNPKAFRIDRLDNKSFAEGRLFHQLILEPEKVGKVDSVDVSSRNTKEYKAYCADRNIEFALLTKEVEEVHKLVGVIKANIAFYDDIYRDGNVFEEPKVGVIKGVNFKGKADIVTHDYIIDLKTTSDINKFKYSAKAYNYDSQCYIYEQLFGKPLYFYVIDKETAQLGVFRPTEQFVKNGELKVERAIGVFEKYFGPYAIEDIDNHFINETLD